MRRDSHVVAWRSARGSDDITFTTQVEAQSRSLFACFLFSITEYQYTTMSSPSLGTSQDVPFTPRREFIKDLAAPQTKSFSLLALSSSNCIRLYSFSPLAITSLRRLLQQSADVVASREDACHNLYEFTLDGKPWANPKSVPTEKLLVDIIAVIYQSGYTYLSTIDYGREPDDRLAMTFSTVYNAAPVSRTATPLSPSTNSPNHDSVAGCSLPLGDQIKPKRIPFAISFSSVTVMRVISPPLHLTPAILQAVRGSWPRGVVAEKKVGGNSYEFKLKGYKCKQLMPLQHLFDVKYQLFTLC